ncbi:hypothetical protein PHISCL_10649, partial [Aspergillus sclerotialis]
AFICRVPRNSWASGSSCEGVWLESRSTDEAYKADFRKLCQVTLENHLDLELILEDPDSGFFVQHDRN